MEAVEKTLIYREDDPGLYRKLLPGAKDKDTRHSEATRDESNYVDLGDSPDMKSEGTKTVKVTFTGEGNQLAVFKCNSDTSGDRSPGGRELDDNVDNMYSKDNWADTGPVSDGPPLVPNFENGETTGLQTDVPPRAYSPQQVPSESEELRYTDMYLNSTTESDEAASVVMSESDQCAPDTVEDESHYITTHEIQLTELDHDVDYDFGRGTRWDIEDDNLVYSFVDYASFESDATAEGRLILQGRRQRSNSSKAQSHNAHQRAAADAAAAVVSMELESDSDKCASSDESMCKHQNGSSGNPAGQIHLSIKTSSRAINESNNTLENDNICYRSKSVGDRQGHFFFGSSDARAEALMCDRVPCFIPAPGRQHLATKLRGKDINEYSSGGSSSISELDDADKEVRNLTAKSFRSLACPYFDAINLSTSSDSSMSEYGLGLNKWSAFVDLKYGNMSNVSQGREQSLIAHKSSTAMFEMSKNTDYKAMRSKGTAEGSGHAPQTKKVSSPRHASSSSQQIELSGAFQPGRSEVITLTETLNFRCNVEAGLPELGRRPKCSENARGLRSTVDEVTGPVPARPGCEAGQPGDVGDNMEDTHKKAIFASSLLKNVISKKMQLEHERKMERGEIRDRHTAQAHAQSQSPCFPNKDPDVGKERGAGRGVHRQTSESGSGFTSNSADESGAADSRPASCEPTRERRGSCDALAPESFQPAAETGFDVKRDTGEPTRGALGRSQNSAFKSWRDGELEPQKEEIDTRGRETGAAAAAGRSKLTKLSQLFVPSSQLLSKDTEVGGVVSKRIAATGEPVEHWESGDRKLGTDNNARATVGTGGYGRGSKAPEIKICLRSVKENKGNPLNIANLLTPNIGPYFAHPLKAQCPIMPGAVADKVPHFTVRDIRDNKWRFQTPIHHVRDVRKLVKSSYRFVSLDNGESKCPVTPAAAAAELREDNKATKKEPNKNPSPSPIIIKCHSVKTNSSVLNQRAHVADAPKRRPTESDRSSPSKPSSDYARNEPTSPHRATGRTAPVFAKQSNPDQPEPHPNPETKTAKQRQEKTTDAAGERKPESKVPKQAALEKLKAAVKTMEQLYIFDRNEWKRKTQAPRPITDSHVLSLIASEEQGGGGSGSGSGRAELEEFLSAAAGCDRLTSSDAHSDKFPPLSDTSPSQEERVIHVPYAEEAFQTQAQQHSQQFSNQSVFHVGRSEKLTVANDASLTCPPSQAPLKPRGAPLSLKIFPPTRAAVDRVRLKASPTESHASLPQPCQPGNTESENYLTMPVEVGVGAGVGVGVTGGSRCGSETKLPALTTVARPHPPGVSLLACGGQPRVSMETGSPNTLPPTTATIYHHRRSALPKATAAMTGGVVPQQQQQPQVFCFSSGGGKPDPPSPAPSPTPSQRKMLLDPITGHFYLVDTPLALPAIRRLYDPETGHFLDVPVTVPQTPGSPVSPVPPVPLPVPPLALPPGAYAASAPTYMIYPGFLSPPPLLPGPALSLAPPHPEAGGGKAAAGGRAQQEGVAESPYYSATGGRVHATVPMPVTLGKVGGARGAMATAATDRKPVISITSQQQQGPRIVAPPSFDGTTMSFVVEHR